MPKRRRTEFSASLSVRTQQIIDLETGITSVIDPLGGSYYVEWLTKKFEEEALTEYSASLADKQIRRLNKVRNERDNAKLDRAKEKLTQTLEKEERMIPVLIDAVKCGLTRGEFAGIKAEVYNLPGEGPYVCSPPYVLA